MTARALSVCNLKQNMNERADAGIEMQGKINFIEPNRLANNNIVNALVCWFAIFVSMTRTFPELNEHLYGVLRKMLKDCNMGLDKRLCTTV